MQSGQPALQKFELIDFLKGFSILTIVLYHYLQPVFPSGLGFKAIAFGGTGIHLFFMLSGFGLAYSQLRKPLNYGLFIKRKFAKIYIPYMVAVGLTALISLFLPLFPSNGYAFWGHALLYKMFDQYIMSSYGYQFWFISTLFQFYLLFPLLFSIFERSSTKGWLTLVFLLSGAWIALTLYLGEAENRVFNGAFFTYLWEFGLGMLLAKKTLEKQQLPNPSNKQLWLSAGLGLLLYAAIGFSGNANWRATNDVFALTGYTALAWLIYRLGGSQIRRLFLRLNAWGYPLFLLHMLLLEAAKHFSGNQSNIDIILFTLLLAFLAASQFERLLRWYYAKAGI